MRDRRRATRTGVAALGAVLVAGELCDWRESHRALGGAPGLGDREVVVLGYRDRGSRPNVIALPAHLRNRRSA